MEVIGYEDSACKGDQNIAILRRTASTTDAIVGMGTTCSGSCQAMFGVLQKKVGDSSDSGVQMPILSDTCIRPGLAKISEWAFRNVPNEITMYDELFKWLRREHPNVKTFTGGSETDQGHSFITYTAIIVQMAVKHGFEWVGPAVPELGPKVKQGMKELQAAAKSQHWLMGDTSYSVQARKIKKQNADMVLVASHPFSACGMLKEMKRQRIKPKLLVGLTSSASQETLNGCVKEAEGIIIPTGFAPITAESQKANRIVSKAGGFLDLHSSAAWENAYLVKAAVERAAIMGTPDSLQQDRRNFRNALASITSMDGLIGPVSRDPASGEASKPYVYVQVVNGKWKVIHDPRS
jgi:branched-chain amino acid transport system substrate-binding protein